MVTLTPVGNKDGGAVKSFSLSRSRQAEAPQQPVDQPWYQDAATAAGDILRIGSNAVTLGMRDRLAPMLTGRSVEDERAMTQEARDRAGTAGFATEIGGAMALPGGLARAGFSAASAPLAAGMQGFKGLALRSGLLGAEGEALSSATALGNDEAYQPGIGLLSGIGGNLLGEGISAGVGKAAGLLGPKPQVMSPSQLSSAKNEAYKRVDDLGAQYAPAAFDDLVKGMTDEVKAANISPMRHPKASSMMEEVQGLAGSSPTITQLDQLRQVIRRDVANSTDDAEAFFGRKMVKNIDEFVRAAGPGQVVAGNADEAAQAISRARDLNTRVMKTENVNDAVESARLRAASTGSGGNVDNATRQNLRRVLENGNFTPDERAAFEKVIVGTKGQDLLRLAGKLSPSGNGLMAALGIGGTMVNPLVGVASLGGMGAKALADRTTSKNVEELAKIIAAGGSRAATVAPKNATQLLAHQKRDALARALMASGLVTAR